MSDFNSLFLNGLFIGQFTKKPIAINTMLEAFQKTSVKVLQSRLQIIRTLCDDIGKTNYKYSPFKKVLKNLFSGIRPLLIEPNFIKLLEIDWDLYDSKEFARIYKHNYEQARDLYQRYLDEVDHPCDLELYLKPMHLFLTEKHFRTALRSLDPQLELICAHLKVYELIIQYNDYDLLLLVQSKEKLIKYFGLIWQSGVNLIGNDASSQKLIDQAQINYPRLTMTKKAYKSV